MFLSSLGEAGVAHPPISCAGFSPSAHTRRLLPLQKVVLYLFAGLFCACESGVVRQVHYYEKIGDTASARQYLETELLRRPDDAEARYLLGKVLFREHAFVEGRTAFDRVEAQTARFSESIQFILESGYREELRRGIEALEAGDGEAAVQRLEYATHIRPEYNPGHRLLGFAFTQTGRLSEASAAYQEAVAIEPSDFESWNNLSEIAFVGGDFEAACDYAKVALELDPENILVLRRLARVYVNLGENEPARRAFEQVLALSSNAQDLRDYAFFLFNTGDLEAARPVLEKLAAAPQPTVDLLKSLSETYAGLELFNKVIEINEKILARLPEDRAAIGNMIAAHERLGQFDKAEQWQARLSKLGGEM